MKSASLSLAEAIPGVTEAIVTEFVALGIPRNRAKKEAQAA
jgi:hypothetical protein